MQSSWELEKCVGDQRWIRIREDEQDCACQRLIISDLSSNLFPFLNFNPPPPFFFYTFEIIKRWWYFWVLGWREPWRHFFLVWWIEECQQRQKRKDRRLRREHQQILLQRRRGRRRVHTILKGVQAFSVNFFFRGCQDLWSERSGYTVWVTRFHRPPSYSTHSFLHLHPDWDSPY